MTQTRESFTHDFLGRLEVEQNCTTSEWKYHYDDLGNLRRRERLQGPGSDVVADFTVAGNATLPHSVKRLTEGSVVRDSTYLPAGQARTVGNVTLDWAPFGLPRRAADGFRTTTFGEFEMVRE